MRQFLVLFLLLLQPVLGRAQEPVIYRDQAGWIGGVAFSPDSRTLAAASADRTIRLVDLENPKMSRVLLGHSDHVAAVAFSPDGKTLASAGFDATARLWDLNRGEPRHVLRAHRGVVTSVAFAHDGRFVATGGIDTQVILWDLVTGKPLHNLKGHRSWVNTVVFSPKGSLATGSSDNTVRLWTQGDQGWSETVQFEFSEGEVRSLAFSPDGMTLAVGVRYGTLKIIDVAKKTVVASKKAHAADVWAIAFAPDGKTLASGDGDWDRPGDVRLWDTATWKETGHLKTSGEVLALAFSPNGKHLAAGCWDKTVHLWDLRKQKAAGQGGVSAKPPEFQLTFTKNVTDAPFTGRVFVVASKQPIKDGPFRQGWFKPEPFFAQDVKNWKPGETLTFAPPYQFPQPLAKLPAGKYYLQALLDRDLGGQSPFAAPGNGFSKAVVLDPDGQSSSPISLTIDQVAPQRKFVDKDRVKLVDIPSKMLSAFHGKPMRLRAGVVLPPSFAKEPERRYPVLYEIPGFSGDHHMAFAVEGRKVPEEAVEMVHVVLDPACRLGHHVFADSANNGPYGQALIEELIPHIEKTYRGLCVPGARFLTGHSSGGWSSLWLQVTNPDFFGGTWSTAPDPVDFRDFQKVDIYQPGVNLFKDEKGNPRPLARKAGKPVLHYQPFNDMEVVFGRGGQLFSFEAVFSPKGTDGQPMKLWDRTSGAVDPKVAQSWEKYDIRLVLERNWPRLGPKLRGKLHVYTGAEDTFYLDGATALLQKALKDRGSDAVVEIVPGRDHGTLLDAKLRDRIAREMAQKLGK